MEPTVLPLVLIVDDEIRLRRVVSDYLHIKGYEVAEAADGVEALEICAQRSPALILLDVMMPRMDGFEACRRLRERGDRTPVLFLTARGQEEDELQGFRLGADEYVTKPFSLSVLLARIEAVLRRADNMPAAVSVASGLDIHREGRTVRIDGRPVGLTYTEFELLCYLKDNSGIALSRDKILDNVWRYDYYGDARTVDTHIKKLRSKLGTYGDCIKTIRGVGYKFQE